MLHLGVTLYHWSRQDPASWILETLAPKASGFPSEPSPVSFWYTLFDARAPHVFAIYSFEDAAPGTSEKGFRQALEDHLAKRLESSPLPIELTEEEVLERHRDCRGKQLCRQDGRPGLAPPNSWAVFEQSRGEYPFSILEKSDAPEELWRRWQEACSWTMIQLQEGNRQLAGILWIAAMARALAPRPELARAYWRRHICSLLLPMRERLDSEGEAAVLASLPVAIGAQNQKIFQQVWQHPGLASLVETHGKPTIDLLFAKESSPEKASLDQLRELNHVVAQQLMLPIRSQIPVLLHAWWSSARAP